MATIEDLDHKSISEMSTDEAIELLRNIRLSRRTQKKPAKKTSSKSTKVKKKANDLSPDQAKQLLKLITGGN